VARSASAILDHRARRRIYEHVLLLPGNHFRGIVRDLRLSVGVVRYHLEVLAKARLVQEEKVDGRVRYYPRGGDATKLYRSHWKYRDLRFRVLQTVHESRETRPAAIARALGISRQLATYHLVRLAKQGQIQNAGGAYRPR